LNRNWKESRKEDKRMKERREAVAPRPNISADARRAQ